MKKLSRHLKIIKKLNICLKEFLRHTEKISKTLEQEEINGLLEPIMLRENLILQIVEFKKKLSSIRIKEKNFFLEEDEYKYIEKENKNIMRKIFLIDLENKNKIDLLKKNIKNQWILSTKSRKIFKAYAKPPEYFNEFFDKKV